MNILRGGKDADLGMLKLGCGIAELFPGESSPLREFAGVLVEHGVFVEQGVFAEIGVKLLWSTLGNSGVLGTFELL